MKSFLLTFACLACVSATDCRAEEFKFDDWTVTVTPAEAKADEAAPAASVEKTVKHETIIRRVFETRVVNTQFAAPRIPYYGYGSNYSIYFPWRNYRGRGFVSYYRPRTIYNYGYGR